MKGLIKFFVAMSAGVVYGLLFAQRPGKKFRDAIKTSKNPGSLIFNELKKVDYEARDTMVEWAKNSEDLQNLMSSGRDQFDAFVEEARKHGTTAATHARKQLLEVSRYAQEAAENLKKGVKETGEKLDDMMDEVDENIDEAFEKAKEKAHDAKKKATKFHNEVLKKKEEDEK